MTSLSKLSVRVGGGGCVDGRWGVKVKEGEMVVQEEEEVEEAEGQLE